MRVPIAPAAEELGLTPDDLGFLGTSKAKVRLATLERLLGWSEPGAAEPDGATAVSVGSTTDSNPTTGARGKLVLVTAINPTPAGEGKTTVSIGLADALRQRGVRAALALRESSLGPVFGVKGGGAGGGKAALTPADDIDLHFTGDLHAITSANNLLAAMLDNHIYQGNALGVDPRTITWRRCLDVNDRQLRDVVTGLGGGATRVNGLAREDGFDITAASEIMAILALASSFEDLRERLGRIVVGNKYDGTPVTANNLEATGSLLALLRYAIEPNLVQTLEGTPALVHAGPFANIAHGCNSVIASQVGLHLADVLVTEAGFGADLGAEKFLDIKCRVAGLSPDVAVVVATIRALKLHGGVAKSDLDTPDLPALTTGLRNLRRHLDNLRGVYNVPVVVAVNRFPSDTDEELALVAEQCAGAGVRAVPVSVFADGGAGGLGLADVVSEVLETEAPSPLPYAYPLEAPLLNKIEAVAQRVYRAGTVTFTQAARREAARLEQLGFGELPVCISKTPYSFSDDPKAIGAPTGFNFTVNRLKLQAGAGFVVAYAGSVITMPGLPPTPAATRIDVTPAGEITGIA